jgi:hypothetical protein
MWKGLVVALMALGWVGCASPQRVEMSAVKHEERASQLQAEGRYYEAEKERAAAAKQRAKAAERANRERAYGPTYW